ncbi:MAG: hypothetical protein PWQ48_1524 [Thermotogaceae bacterium]|jgi:Rrf2 family protein|nr:hypothetical protein [Thermotogaceae bacterium]
MIINKEIRYALRIILRLAIENRLMSSKKLSESECIPHRFTLKILHYLKKYGLVQSVPGKKGGYILSRQANSITFLEILNIFKDDSEALVKCELDCPLRKNCVARNFWQWFNDSLSRCFQNLTIENIIKGDFKDQLKF